MANDYTDVGIFERDGRIDNLDRSIELLWERRDEHAGVLGQFFNDQMAESMSYKLSSVSSVVGMPVENEDTEEAPYVTSAPGFDKTFTLVPYRLFVRVTGTMLLADRFNNIVAQTGGLITSSMRRIEYLRAGTFTNAFTGTAGADGKPLVGDDHPQEDNRATNWDNEGTGALTGANLQALVLLGQNMTNEIGAPDPVDIKKLLVPTALRQKALELTGSVLAAEVSTNTKTVIIGGIEVVTSPHLTGSATAYFGFGDREGENKGLHEIYLMRPELANTGNNPVDIPIDKRIKFITQVGFTTSRNVIGSLGT